MWANKYNETTKVTKQQDDTGTPAMPGGRGVGCREAGVDELGACNTAEGDVYTTSCTKRIERRSNAPKDICNGLKVSCKYPTHAGHTSS